VHFPEEAGAQRGEVTGPESHSSRRSIKIDLGLPDAELLALYLVPRPSRMLTGCPSGLMT
jgi:hypothetical protein